MSLESEFFGREPLRVRSHTTIRDLQNGIIPQQPTNDETVGYRKIGDATLVPFKQGANNYFIVGPAMDGYELHGMMYHAAPSKYYGIDFSDLNDWKELYHEGNEKLLEAHRGIPGWTDYEKHRISLLNHLLSDRPDAERPNIDKVRPVVHIERNLEGKLKWNVGDLAPGIEAEMRRSVPDEDLAAHKLHPVLGPLFVAAYAPGVTSKWPHRESFNEDGRGFDMGATQAIPLTIMRGADLLRSNLVSAMIRHCDMV